jgi:hypothetical protein
LLLHISNGHRDKAENVRLVWKYAVNARTTGTIDNVALESDILPIKLRPFALDPFCPLSEQKVQGMNARQWQRLVKPSLRIGFQS